MKKGLRRESSLVLREGHLVGRIDLMKKGLRPSVDPHPGFSPIVGRIDLMKKGLRLIVTAEFKTCTPLEGLT